MPVVSEMVHPRGLDFHNQRRVVVLRYGRGMSWEDIAAEVTNLEGEPSTRDCVRRVYEKFNGRRGHCTYKHQRCGRKGWKTTRDVQAWLVRRMLVQRKKSLCTSTSLQSDLAKVKGLVVSASCIRKVLAAKVFEWPRERRHGSTARLTCKPGCDWLGR